MTNEIMNPARLKSRGLGRGLSALLDDGVGNQDHMAQPQTQSYKHDHAHNGLNRLAIEFIHPNKDQPRTQFSSAELEELAQSLKEKGMIQPILVRPHPNRKDHYQIIAGERRWRAAQLAGLFEVPTIIKNTNDGELLELALIENIQRQDLSPIEEARSYRKLMDNHGYTQEKMAQLLGKSRSHIANSLRLNSLPETVQDWLLDGSLSAGHARALIGKDNAVVLAANIIEHGLSVRQAEALRLDDPVHKSKKSQKSEDPDTMALMDRLSQALGMKVALKDRQGKGQLRIDYKSLEELDYLIAAIERLKP